MKLLPLLSSLIAVCLAACSSVPTAGPTKSQIIDQAANQQAAQQHFALVDIDPAVIAALSAEPRRPSASWLADAEQQQPPNPTIGVGDLLSVAIWDSSTGGLFGAPPETAPGMAALPGAPGASSVRNVVLPDQVVGRDGSISVPYAGRIPVAGRTPFDVQQVIQQRLAKTSFDPQALVTIAKSGSQNVTVSGETMSGMRVTLSPRGERLLDVIADAGGAKSPPYEIVVSLTRNGRVALIPMSRLVSDPASNIYVLPGDVITLLRLPQTFTVFGATLNNTEIPFGANHLDLTQAIAKSGGLQDTRADPEGVFLFRFESQSVAATLGIKLSGPAPAGQVPIVYHLNLRNVASYFLARQFAVRDDDIIYVANAPMNDLQKFFTLVGTITGPVLGLTVVDQISHH